MQPRQSIANQKREKREKNLFKKPVMKKTSAILTTALVASVLSPVIAFAGSWLNNSSYESSTGKFATTVSTDVYSPAGVSVKVYDQNGNYITTVNDATYERYESVNGATYYYYDVTGSVTANTYSSLKLWADGVTDAVYVTPAPPAGYGGGLFPGSNIVNSDGRANAALLEALVKNNTNAELKISGEFVLLPATALAAGKNLTIYNDTGSYTLPLDKLDIDAHAKALGVDAKDLWIRVQIAKVSGDALTAVQSAAKQVNGTVIGDSVDFQVTAEAAGKTAIDVSFGQTYVKRTINIDKGYTTINTNTTTAAVYDPATQSFGFVPSTFGAKGEKAEVVIWRVGNSVYTVLESNNSFTDIATHWAKGNIELLANKLVVDGYEDGSFGAERSITRAEFAALIVRALGITPTVTSNTYFTDVAPGQWYTNIVNTAASAGLIDGYADRTFQPNAKINREELAALVVRAMKYAGKEVTVDATEQASLLTKFTDAKQIVWGQAEVAAAIKSGIVDGMTDTTLSIRSDATRAQSATMLKRFLEKTDFIN
ncbi:S-layer homology domain-containing protein [Paenibacillus sp. CC-CFT747]|nr:S-layer homology domain-containing protein [Paenibacillus sp. CC-CFT747]